MSLGDLILIGLVVAAPLWPGALEQGAQPKRQPTPSIAPSPAATVAPFPTKSSDAVEPVITAKSALLLDLPSNTTLYSKNPDQPLPVASLAKLMTAILVVEKLSPETIVTTPATGTGLDESRIGFEAGEQFRAEDLLAGLLIVSGNDAAKALATQVAGSEEAFVKLMNKRAEELGLQHTHFSTASGFDTGETFSSARELSLIARAALAEPRIRALAGQKELTIKNAAGKEYKLLTTDQLIGTYLPIAGLKTGTTDAAGPCLISALISPDRQLLAVVLNSPDRFQENKAMLDWALRSHIW